MARRWTPQRFVTMRRIRIMVCVAAVALVCVVAFMVSARKTVALTVNGETRTVTTYTQSVDRLLQEQGITTKTHDVVKSTTGGALQNHSVVSMNSAYQATITIDGQEVPFWTSATSASQLLSFFKSSEQDAAKVTVNISNVYNQLTGGLVINKEGPVTVIADGNTSIAPDGKLSAASILDSKNIALGKDDRISVEEDGGNTILRVQRVTHGDETQMISIPFASHTVVDASLQPGEQQVRQVGQTGTKEQVYDVTYVDGQAEGKALKSETVTTAAMDEIIAVGPAAPAASPDGADSGDAHGAKPGNGGKDTDKTDQDAGKGNTDKGKESDKGKDNPKPNDSGNQNSKPNANGNGSSTQPAPTPAPQPAPAPQPKPEPAPAPKPEPAPEPTPSGLWHASAHEAQVYAQGAAAAYGWTGQEYTDLVTLWNKESGWRWNAGNPKSGAYGIPQALPGKQMGDYGANWKDDAAIQINWGLNYIKGRYGSPSAALNHWRQYNWY